MECGVLELRRSGNLRDWVEARVVWIRVRAVWVRMRARWVGCRMRWDDVGSCDGLGSEW